MPQLLERREIAHVSSPRDRRDQIFNTSDMVSQVSALYTPGEAVSLQKASTGKKH